MLRRGQIAMMTGLQFLQWSLVLYAATLLVTSARVFQAPRNLFRRVAFQVFKGTEFHNSFVHVVPGARGTRVVLENDKRDEEDVREEGVGYDFISCRMCVGVWLTIPLLVYVLSPLESAAAYGLSYFLATQERQ